MHDLSVDPGAPPGKYRVAIAHEKKGGDAFRGAYDGDRSPFEFEVNGSTPPLVIDREALDWAVEEVRAVFAELGDGLRRAA